MTTFYSQRNVLMGLIIGAIFCCTVLLADEPVVASQSRDWSEVQLAWRGDPRAPVDAPSGVEVPQGRRSSRRSQRRAARRRMPLDDVPISLGSDGENNPRSLLEIQAGWPLDVPLDTPSMGSQRQQSIRVETTRGSPFESDLPALIKPLVHRDQPYGTLDNSRQRFDIILPADCGGEGGLPLVVWIHGDTWRNGSKADCPIQWLIEEGYAVASIGYRLSDTAVFPAQLDDCQECLSVIIKNAAVWGIDKDRICVIGAAAGGHLAALLGLSSPPHVAAICAVSAPSHLTTLGPEHDRAHSPASLLVGGPLLEFREAAQRASPLTHVSPDDPPVLLVHGRLDAIVPVDQSVRLDTALRAAGVESRLVILNQDAHKPALTRTSLAGKTLLTFLDTELGPGIRIQAIQEVSPVLPSISIPPPATLP